jgi:hypothetical protein
LALTKLAGAYSPAPFDPECVFALTDGRDDPIDPRPEVAPFIHGRNRTRCVSPDDPRFFNDGFGGFG